MASIGLHDLDRFLRDRARTIEEGIFFFDEPSIHDRFSSDYLSVRKSEGRLYPDSIVASLPSIQQGHPHAFEWAIRRWTLTKLESYLTRMKDIRSVLDLGCGNGWMTNALAAPDRIVIGCDVVREELEQASRVFRANSSVRWVYGDLINCAPPEPFFDLAIAAGSIQYLPSLAEAIRQLLKWLRPWGEVHIVDSPLYASREVAGAAERSAIHYRSLSAADFRTHYHHHLLRELDPFDAAVLYDPSSLLHRLERHLGRAVSPFPWIRVRKPA